MKTRLPGGGWRRLACGVALAALALARPCAGQDEPRPPAEGETVRLPPLKARLWVGKESRDVTLVGRTDLSVLVAGGVEGAPAAKIRIAQIARAQFDLGYDPGEVAKAERRSDWGGAIRLLQPGLKGPMAYLDLPDNNAAEAALDMGTCMLRAAHRTATKPEEQAQARRQYEAAAEVFTACARAEWSRVAQLGVLKGCRCLLGINKVKTAQYHVNRMSEPAPGDAAYGHYWLVRAELAHRAGQFREALDAVVKSVCFENKDIETFPDALLLSARCYEETLDPYRARDVYFEVASIFPRTDWADDAADRLQAILDAGKTRGKEVSPIENVFFGMNEDINKLAAELLRKRREAAKTDDEAEKEAPPPKEKPPEE